MNRKGEFKVKNLYNLTTEQVKNEPVYYRYEDGRCELMATLTHADKDYIHGCFIRNSEYDILIEGNAKCMSMEIVGDMNE